MDSSPGQLSNSSACSQTTPRATRRTPTGSITLLRKFCPAVTWSTGGGQQVAHQGPGGLETSRRRATFAEDRHVIAEEASVAHTYSPLHSASRNFCMGMTAIPSTRLGRVSRLTQI